MVTKSPFCEATGTLSLRLQLTLPMGFKARVDPPWHALRSHLKIPTLRSGPNITPWLGEATAGMTTQCRFLDGWQIQTHDLAAQGPTLLTYVDLHYVGNISHMDNFNITYTTFFTTALKQYPRSSC